VEKDSGIDPDNTVERREEGRAFLKQGMF